MSPKHEIIWANVAHADLVEIIQYIRADNPSAATDSLKKIKDRVSELTLFPQQGCIVPELKQQGILHYRELIIPPWRVIYRLAQHQVYILSVIDARRNIEDILLDRLVRHK
jgi:toxin ParE1/3/4